MSNKTVTIHYSVRLPQSIHTKLVELAELRSQQVGRTVRISDVLLSSLDYGMPVFESETKHHISIPRGKSRSEQIAHVALELIRKGFEVSFPDSELAPSSAA